MVAVAGLCDAHPSRHRSRRAIVTGIVLANVHGVGVPEERPFPKTMVQLTIGVPFISISATVTPASLRGVLWPSVGLVACLVLLVRPHVAAITTVRTA